MLGSSYNDFQEDQPRDRKVIKMIRAMDCRTLSEATAIYAISEMSPSA